MGSWDFHNYCVVISNFSSREPNPLLDSLHPYFLLDAGDDKGICYEFLEELDKRWDEDESVKNVITKAVVNLSEVLSHKTMNDTYKPYITVFNPILIQTLN